MAEIRVGHGDPTDAVASYCRRLLQRQNYGWRTASQRPQVVEGTLRTVEDEREDIRPVLFAAADEAAQVRLVRDVERHVSLGARHLELHVAPALSRRIGQVERYIGDRELERDLLVDDGARAEDGQRLSGHWHC